MAFFFVFLVCVFPRRVIDMLVEEFGVGKTDRGNLFWSCVVLAILWIERTNSL